ARAAAIVISRSCRVISMTSLETNHTQSAVKELADQAGAASPSAVRIRGVNHTYGEGELAKQVLFDNLLDIHRGELVIMTGPSGSGKTTLLTLIGGLRSVQEGSLEVLSHEMHGLSHRE